MLHGQICTYYSMHNQDVSSEQSSNTDSVWQNCKRELEAILFLCFATANIELKWTLNMMVSCYIFFASEGKIERTLELKAS